MFFSFLSLLLLLSSTFPSLLLFSFSPSLSLSLQVQALLSTIIETQPKVTGGGATTTTNNGGEGSESTENSPKGKGKTSPAKKKKAKNKADKAPPAPTREDIVVEKANELLLRLPSNFVEDIYREQLDRQGGLSGKWCTNVLCRCVDPGLILD